MLRHFFQTVGAALGVLVLTVWPAASAEEADVNAIIKSLAPIAGQTVTPGYGGGTGADAPVVRPHPRIPPHYHGRPVQIIIDQRPILLDYGSSLEMEVFFAYDSALLTPRARRQLAALGMALESQALMPYRYLIAGHTDARGSRAYNAELSYRRAWAVKRFLIRNFAIDPARLEAVGWGEMFLRDPARPYAAVNRRVEIILIQPVLAPTTMVPMGGGTVTVVPAPTVQPPLVNAPPMVAAPAVAAPTAGWAPPPLPPCPAQVTGDPRNPRFDLDDFRPEPGIDCDPNLPPVGQMTVGPDGQVIYNW